jgi:hypothetical protein
MQRKANGPKEDATQAGITRRRNLLRGALAVLGAGVLIQPNGGALAALSDASRPGPKTAAKTGSKTGVKTVNFHKSGFKTGGNFSKTGVKTGPRLPNKMGGNFSNTGGGLSNTGGGLSNTGGGLSNTGVRTGVKSPSGGNTK